MTAQDALLTRYPNDIVTALIDAYTEIESNFTIRKWKASELDAGHFVEAARRIVEQELFSKHTPIGKNLPKFTDTVLKQYESGSGDEAFRILIPAVLKAMYSIRNRRGVAHLARVSPNQMDATFILYSAKWVLAELVRIASGKSVAETQALVEQIVERRIEVLWKHGNLTKVLSTKIRAPNQVLVLLYDKSPQTESDLQKATEYKNASDFRKILKKLHREKLIHYDAAECRILPAGIVQAEKVLLEATAPTGTPVKKPRKRKARSGRARR